MVFPTPCGKSGRQPISTTRLPIATHDGLAATPSPRWQCSNNAALAGVFFPQAKVGVLEEGAFADIIFVDYHPITPMSSGNLPWHILFGFEPSMVTTTICGGKVLMKDRELLFLDEAEITAKSRELAAKVWERYWV